MFALNTLIFYLVCGAKHNSAVLKMFLSSSQRARAITGTCEEKRDALIPQADAATHS